MIRKFSVVVDVDEKFTASHVDMAIDNYLKEQYDGKWISFHVKEMKE